MAILSSYLTTCLKSPTNIAIEKIKKIYFPFVASNHNLITYHIGKRLKAFLISTKWNNMVNYTQQEPEKSHQQLLLNIQFVLLVWLPTGQNHCTKLCYGIKLQLEDEQFMLALHLSCIMHVNNENSFFRAH